MVGEIFCFQMFLFKVWPQNFINLMAGSGCCPPGVWIVPAAVSLWHYNFKWFDGWGCDLWMSNEIYICSCCSCFLTAINIFCSCADVCCVIRVSSWCWTQLKYQIFWCFLFAQWNGVRWAEVKWDEMKWVKYGWIVSPSHPLLIYWW